MKPIGKKTGSSFSFKSCSFEKLDSLLELANAGSMTATANSKGKEIGSISRHIKDLEQFIGCNLRQKSGKTTSLSPEGVELANLVRRQLEELKSFKDKHTKNLNAVSLAAGDSLLHLILFPKLAQIHAKFSKTTFTISASSTFEIIQGLQNLTIDLGLLRKDSLVGKGAESLRFQELGEYRYAIFIPSSLITNKEMTEKEIFKLPFATIRDHWDIDFLELANNAGQNFENMRVFCQNFTQIFRLIRLGQYAGILPIFCKHLLPEETICFEPEFLKGRKHDIVLAYNSSLVNLKQQLPRFIGEIVEDLRIGVFDLLLGT
jgi:DNA-binding transcriptional LysR family regulator